MELSTLASSGRLAAAVDSCQAWMAKAARVRSGGIGAACCLCRAPGCRLPLSRVLPPFLHSSSAGVSIAIMGCIVNGPGEMADADFG